MKQKSIVKVILETDRLLLRELVVQDAAFILVLLNSPGWLQFIGDRNVRSKEEAVNYLKNGPIKSYKENGFGLYLVERKEDQKSIGVCGMIIRVQLEHPDLGFAFLPEYFGKGYAYEIARQTIVHASTNLKIKPIWAIVDPLNIKSQQLLKKLGFLYTKKIYPFEDRKELLLLTYSVAEVS